jgi:hypothetical protein
MAATDLPDLGRLQQIPESPQPKTCGTCFYGRGRLTHPDLPPNTRKCQRFPPQLSALLAPGPNGRPQVIAHSDWPQVQLGSSCGEHPEIQREALSLRNL